MTQPDGLAQGGPSSAAADPAPDRGPLRVVVVDDHAMFRTGVKAEIGRSLDVVGEAEDVESAVRVVLAKRPDVVLLDVHLPGGGGAEVLRRVHEREPDQRFLALSVSDAAEDVIGVIRGGARGYVTKSISGPELVDAVRRVAEGDAVFSPRLAGFVLDAFGVVSGETAETTDELDRLSSPIGLDLGARTPEETAVSIAAEIIAGRWGGSGERLTGADGPIHRTADR